MFCFNKPIYQGVTHSNSHLLLLCFNCQLSQSLWSCLVRSITLTNILKIFSGGWTNSGTVPSKTSKYFNKIPFVFLVFGVLLPLSLSTSCSTIMFLSSTIKDQAHCRQCDSFWKIPNIVVNKGALMSLLMPAVVSQQTAFAKCAPSAMFLPSV